LPFPFGCPSPPLFTQTTLCLPPLVKPHRSRTSAYVSSSLSLMYWKTCEQVCAHPKNLVAWNDPLPPPPPLRRHFLLFFFLARPGPLPEFPTPPIHAPAPSPFVALLNNPFFDQTKNRAFQLIPIFFLTPLPPLVFHPPPLEASVGTSPLFGTDVSSPGDRSYLF